MSLADRYMGVLIAPTAGPAVQAVELQALAAKMPLQTALATYRRARPFLLKAYAAALEGTVRIGAPELVRKDTRARLESVRRGTHECLAPLIDRIEALGGELDGPQD